MDNLGDLRIKIFDILEKHNDDNLKSIEARNTITSKIIFIIAKFLLNNVRNSN